jgi:hypothetical protein
MARRSNLLGSWEVGIAYSEGRKASKALIECHRAKPSRVPPRTRLARLVEALNALVIVAASMPWCECDGLAVICASVRPWRRVRQRQSVSNARWRRRQRRPPECRPNAAHTAVLLDDIRQAMINHPRIVATTISSCIRRRPASSQHRPEEIRQPKRQSHNR